MTSVPNNAWRASSTPNYENVRKKLTEIIPAGLVRGLGKPSPGEFCVEAAVCFAMGEPHSDMPSCVAEPDRTLLIRLNDLNWSSNQKRAVAVILCENHFSKDGQVTT